MVEDLGHAVRPGRSDARLSREAFAALFQESYRRLWCIAAAVLGGRGWSRTGSGVGSGGGPEDVLQEAALVAWNKVDEFDPASDFGAWMAQIVRFAALNQMRRNARDRGLAFDGESLAARDGSGAEPADIARSGGLRDGQTIFDDRLASALATLDETARACLLLRTVLELSYREIGATLGIPEGTAMSHVHRARKRMRAELADSESTAAGAGEKQA